MQSEAEAQRVAQMVLLDFSNDTDSHPYPIFARSQWEIPQPPPSHVEEDQQNLGDVRDDTCNLIKLLHHSKRQSLVIRSVSQHLYSCVGMVFANRRTWLNPDKLLRILKEDGYTRVTDHSRLSIGDVALYAYKNKPIHVGLVTKVDLGLEQLIDVRVLSKWGYVGEVEHYVHHVPDFCGNFDSYWSEREPDDV